MLLMLPSNPISPEWTHWLRQAAVPGYDVGPWGPSHWSRGPLLMSQGPRQQMDLYKKQNKHKSKFIIMYNSFLNIESYIVHF